MNNLIGLFATMGMTLVVSTAAVIQSIQKVPEETKTEYIVTKSLDTLVEPVVTVQFETIEHRHDIQLYSQEEAKEIMTVAMLEAQNQHEDGMWFVMSVIVNRVEDPEWPDNVHDVIWQKYAFSSVSQKSMENVEISEECMRAYARIAIGDVCPKIIGFETKDSEELDRYFDLAFIYRDHKFYVKKE